MKYFILIACVSFLAIGALASSSESDSNSSEETPPSSNSTTSAPPGSGSGNRCSSQPAGTVLPSSDCSFFVTCEGGQEVQNECLPLGTMFDHERQVCDHPENVQCWSSNRCADLADGALIPATTCSNFIICMGGEEHEEVECVPTGTKYDFEREVCDHPENVKCWTSDEGGSETSPVDPPGTTLEPTRPPLDASIPSDICRHITIGMLEHPTDCAQFIVCVLGQPNVQQCPPDYVFYPEVGVCGYGNPITCERSMVWLKSYKRAIAYTA